MKAWTFTAAALATLALAAGCTEDGPASMTEAEPETPEAFDPETVYQIVPIGGEPISIERAVGFLQFDSEEAKRRFTEGWTPPIHLVPLFAARADQVWDKGKTVLVVTATADGGWRPIHTHNPPTTRELYGPDRERRREVPR